MRWLTIPAMALLAACQPDVPEIAKNLPSGFTDGERVFDQRVKAQFPIGSEEQKLLDELGRQGFQKKLLDGYDGVRTTTYIRNDASRTFWSVHWHERQHKITDVWGVYGSGHP